MQNKHKFEEVKIKLKNLSWSRSIESKWKYLESYLKREKGVTSEIANEQGNKLRFKIINQIEIGHKFGTSKRSFDIEVLSWN